MRCRACRARLGETDNYCRKCGAAVEYIDVPVLRREPAGQLAQLRAAALPVARQSAFVVLAGTLLRFAVRRWLSSRAHRRDLALVSDRDGEVVEELVLYRRIRTR
jgi:hypothetical protein